MKIRKATQADAAAACEVLRAPISELCVADHRNDPVILDRWLANKTPEDVALWVADPDASLLLAVEDEIVLAVGAVRNDGEITPENAGIAIADCCRLKPRIGSISVAGTSRTGRRNTSSARTRPIR